MRSTWGVSRGFLLDAMERLCVGFIITLSWELRSFVEGKDDVFGEVRLFHQVLCGENGDLFVIILRY